MRLRAFLAALLWCAPATAQVQSAGSIINLVSTAPQAQTPLSASDLYLVIEAGIVKKVLGTQLALSVLGNLGTAGLASLPLSAFDSFLVVQGGVARHGPLWHDGQQRSALRPHPSSIFTQSS